MIYITGDTHAHNDIEKLNTRNFPEQKELTKDDYVIICGDFGCVWDGSKEDDYWLNWLNGKNFTTLFVDGNHENFDLLYQYDVEEFCGGKVHKIRDSVFHLMRGEVFNVDGNKIFAMGGASSHDMHLRREGLSWWRQELPSEEEYQNAVENLAKHDWNVDFIVSHCCPDSIMRAISSYYKHDKLTNFFENVVKADCTYKKWYFGHYHENIVIGRKHYCLYNKIVKMW